MAPVFGGTSRPSRKRLAFLNQPTFEGFDEENMAGFVGVTQIKLLRC
jgi:hypothetical protein